MNQFNFYELKDALTIMLDLHKHPVSIILDRSTGQCHVVELTIAGLRELTQKCIDMKNCVIFPSAIQFQELTANPNEVALFCEEYAPFMFLYFSEMKFRFSADKEKDSEMFRKQAEQIQEWTGWNFFHLFSDLVHLFAWCMGNNIPLMEPKEARKQFLMDQTIIIKNETG